MISGKIQVKKITQQAELKIAHDIRYEVFVIGQNVPAEEEIDKYESECVHFLASYSKVPCGAARWRQTSEGFKLERFAVLEKFRRKGVGSELVKAVLEDIESQSQNTGQQLYLHSQLSAIPLYEKFGFKIEGDIFLECDIEHYTMKKVH